MVEEKDNLITEEKDTPKVSIFWKLLSLFLLGVVIGFQFAPIKKGIYCGNNNSVYNNVKKPHKHKNNKCKNQDKQ